MATKRSVIALATRLEVEISEGLHGDGGTIYADAPSGFTFACSAGDLHSLCSVWHDGEKAAAWEDLAERLSMGIETCGLEDCDVCEEVR